MTPELRKKLTRNIESVLLGVWGIFFLVFPFIISPQTTENFILPKQIFTAIVVLLSLLLLAAKMVISERLRFRRTPFDVPIALFGLALLVSSLLSVNRFDALIAYTPVLLAIVGYYIVVNAVRKESAVVFILSAVVTSGVLLAIIAVFSYLKVYPLPLAFTHQQGFTTLGSQLEQLMYLAAILPIAIMQGKALFKGDTSSKTVGFMAAGFLVGAGLLVTVAQLLTTQKPIILPFETGFQVAFAAISQDTGRVAQGFLFGSGFGNFLSAFTRFKQASFNANQTLWYLPFNASSSFVLELLATTGIIGMFSFLLILFRAVIQPAKKKNNPIYLSLVVLAILAFVLPFSFETIMLLSLVLSLFATTQAIKHPSEFFDIEPRFVALKKGFIALDHATTTQTDERHEYSQVMPYTLAIVSIIFVAAVGLYATRYILSNLSFHQALVAAQNNNGTATYKLEVASINMFPYQSAYYRVFSQTNIALANSIANTQQKGSSPSAQVQSTVYTLLQQGITTAKNATQLSPQDVANWQNLSSVYRALVGIGQGADNFAVVASQQAVTLDPTNPQEYINLGGLYYQLGQYDNAIRTFQQAITLKQDFPNAYYNLGHAYLQKQDPQDALQAFQIVAQLTVNDKVNHDKIMAEIAAIQGQAGSQQAPAAKPTPAQTAPATVQQPLNVSGENPTLPSSPTKIPLEPTATPTPSK